MLRSASGWMASRMALRSLLLAGLVVAYSAAITLFVQSGNLWQLLPAGYKAQPQFQVQSYLMSAPYQAPAHIVIGDTQFTNRFSDVGSVRVFSINALDPHDLTHALRRLNGVLPHTTGRKCTLFLQASPWFLLRMNLRGRAQDYRHFDMGKRNVDWFLPNRATRLFFSTLSDVVRWSATGSKEPGPQTADRPPRYPVQLSRADENLENWNRTFKFIERSDWPVVIVPDVEGSQYSSAPELLRAFEEDFLPAFAEGAEFHLEHVSIATLETASQKMQAPCGSDGG